MNPSKNKILMIDDEENIRKLVNGVLVLNGYTPHFAKDGPEGVSMAKRILPDLILLDIRMPGMDGFEVLRQLKADPATKGIPVVFMTASSVLEDTIHAMSQGAAGYIEKPIDLNRFLRKVNSLLGRDPGDTSQI